MRQQPGIKRILTMTGILTFTTVTMIAYLPEQLLAKPLYRVSPKIPHNSAYPLFNNKTEQTAGNQAEDLSKRPHLDPVEITPAPDDIEKQASLPEKEADDHNLSNEQELTQELNRKNSQEDAIAYADKTGQKTVLERPQSATETAQKAFSVTPYQGTEKSISNKVISNSSAANKANSIKLPEKLKTGNQTTRQNKPVEIASAEPTTLADPIKLYKEANEVAQKGQFKEAALLYQQALKINPKLADAYVGMAATFGAFKKWDRAILLLKDALKHQAHFRDKFNLKHAHYNLAVAYCFSGQLDNAWNEYDTTKSMKHPYKRHLKKLLKKNCPK